MNFKKNLILLAAFLVAAGAYYLYDVKWAGEKKAEEERKAKFLKGVKPELLMRVSLQRKKEPFQVTIYRVINDVGIGLKIVGSHFN